MVLAALVGAAHGQAVSGFAGFNGYGSGAGNGSANFLDANTLQLTDGVSDTGINGLHQDGSAFYATPVTVSGSWSATFTYTPSNFGGPAPADGFTFDLQNDPTGTAFLGRGGDGLGYDNNGTANSSVAVATNIWQYTSNGPGAEFLSGGVVDHVYAHTDPVNLLGVPISYTISYDGTTLLEQLSQGGNTWHQSEAINLSSALGGNTAYIGFTGADGLGLSDQRISNFNFTPGATPEPVTIALGIGGIGVAIARRRRSRS